MRFNTYPTKVCRACKICEGEANNTIHVVYHCPFLRQKLSILENVINIIVYINISMNVNMVMMNKVDSKLIRRIGKDNYIVILICLMIMRKVIYNAYYKEESNIGNRDLIYTFTENIKMIKAYIIENKAFLNHEYKREQMNS